MGGDFNAHSYRYFRSCSQQIAASLQDSSLAAMLRRFDEGINAQHRGIYDNHPEYQFHSDIHMTYHDEHIEEYRLMRNAILDEVTDAAGESTKTPRLQRAVQELDKNFDVISLINFNWEHTAKKPLSIDNRYQREHRVPQSKSTIIKNKYAIRYLAGQEKMCRLSGMAQRITPQLLQLRQRDLDTHRVLKVALQPWPTLAGMKSLIDCGLHDVLGKTYFRADNFCKVYLLSSEGISTPTTPNYPTIRKHYGRVMLQNPLFQDLPLHALITWTRWWHLTAKALVLVLKKRVWRTVGSYLNKEKARIDNRIVRLRIDWSARGRELKRLDQTKRSVV